MTKLRPKDNENYVCKFKISITNFHHKITENPKSRIASAVNLRVCPHNHPALPLKMTNPPNMSASSRQSLHPKEDENFCSNSVQKFGSNSVHCGAENMMMVLTQEKKNPKPYQKPNNTIHRPTQGRTPKQTNKTNNHTKRCKNIEPNF